MSVGYESLRTAKAALDEGLIDASDFNEIKSAFLRAQQIKAGLDAGFILEADYQNVKQAFLNSLNMSAEPGIVTGALPTPAANGMRQSSAPSAQPQVSSKVPSQNQYATNGQRQSRQSSIDRAPTIERAPSSKGASQPPSGQVVRTDSAASTEASPRGQTAVPTNIPKFGGARPKQTNGTSMSGIAVTEDAVNLYYYLKAKQVYRWATWRINDAGNQVVIAAVGEKDSNYSEFLDALPAADCRYGVIDMQFTNSEGCVFNKILFVNWAPDSARIKAKMMYASTKDFFKGYLDGLSIELQGGDLDDISEQEANTAVRSSVTRQ